MIRCGRPDPTLELGRYKLHENQQPQKTGPIQTIVCIDVYKLGRHKLHENQNIPNLYTQLAEALFDRHPLPPALIEFRHGFDSQQLRRIVLSHLRSFAAKHEHKIAGVGYLISQMATLTPAPVDAAVVQIEAPT